VKILGKRILIEPLKDQRKSGSIFLPDSVGQENAEGKVLAIGSEIREALPYTKGSDVFIAMYSGMKVVVLGKDRLLVNQDDICGVMANGAFHPIGNNILLKPVDSVVQNDILIRLPDVSGDSSRYHGDDLRQFTVHLLGNGNRNKKGEYRPFAVGVGDKVLAHPFAGRDVDTIKGTFKLVKQSDIQAMTI